jgi:ppGpp synthetase/RelA/SpoT-type nucleotidyltranferase
LKLEIFDFIEESIELLGGIGGQLEEASSEIERFFKSEMEEIDGFLNMNTRVKTKMSLKEKILRNNYYSKYGSPDEMIYDLSDLIGTRIECRFIEDENKLYRKLLKILDTTEDGKYFYSESNPDIRLKLDDKQPQLQKNGFKIFRIDGKYKMGSREITFELQIKSLVNMFWGEIEHKILYKNFNYVMIEDFFRDIMGSIKENLSMIDRQLMILHDHINEMDEDNDEVRKKQFQGLLSKMIHNMYSHKIKDDLGFVVDFRKPCDIIVKYIFEKSKVYDVSSYSITFLGILGRLKDVSLNEISFMEYIEFERYIKFEDEYEKWLGEPILGALNKDFMWNLLFRILFDIEIGTDTEDFEGFIAFIKDEFLDNLKGNNKLSSRFEDWQRNDIIDNIVKGIADVLHENTCIEFVNCDNIEKINSKITTRVNRIKSFEEWRNGSLNVVEGVKQDIRDILG